MKKTARVAAAILVSTLALTACGEREDSSTSSDDNSTSEQNTSEASETPTESHPDFKACMVSDAGGFDDRSFNQTSHAGMRRAAEVYGIKTGEAQSNADADYMPNLKNLATSNCDQITTVGHKLGDQTLAAAKQNKKIDYAIVDYAYDNPPPNVKGLTFATNEPAYMAGYLAASQSETGIVGTFGGEKIPTVTIFMDGFAQGVARYNEDKDADVKVVGWDLEKQDGSFTNDFISQPKGQSLADALIRQGADVIMPVAGPSGLGALQAVKAADKKAIWVDTDGCISAEEYCDVLLSSVVKGMDVAVTAAIKDSIDGKFDNEPYFGTLENEGVDLAPYHEFEDEISQETKDEIEALKQEIIAGEVDFD